MKLIIGIDISKEYFDVCQQGRVTKYSNNTTGIKQFVKSVPIGSHIIMESTSSYCFILADELIKAGSQAYIVNPLSVSYFIKMGLHKAKTDPIDSIKIQKYGELMIDQLRPYNFASENLEAVKQIQTALEQLKKQRTALLNQIEALKRMPYKSKDVMKALEKLVNELDKQIKNLEKKAEESVKEDQPEMLRNISSIKGIGTDTAVMLISKTNAFKNFKSAKQISSFFGCCPRIVESGSSVHGRGAISKLGHADVRSRLYLCAFSASKYNKACRELFCRLVSKGKSKKVALLAVVNKLIKQIFAIISKNVPYVDGFKISFGS